MARLASIMILVRSVPAATRIYTDALGVRAAYVFEDVAELDLGKNTSLLIQKAEDGSEAPLSTGYSPFINFHVKDFDTTVGNMIQHGAYMDGAIKFPPHGRVAAFRTPDGHMLGICEQVSDAT